LCAVLAALASPLCAGEAAWLTAKDLKHVIRLPADWSSVAAVPGVAHKGITPVYSLAPKSRAFTLDIAAENVPDVKAVLTEDVFARARERAGNPPALREQLSDYSMFEYFRSTAAAKGGARYRVQGVLHKYLHRYYLTFRSARGYPAGKDWEAALRVLGSLDPSTPSAGAWTVDFMEKATDGAGLGPSPAVSGGNLRFTAAARDDGTAVGFTEIAIFGCKNFLGNLYLFNEDRTAHCWIATLHDYGVFLGKLERRYWEASTPYFQDCPQAMRQERACDPGKFRNF